jgi:hypothetical protein
MRTKDGMTTDDRRRDASFVSMDIRTTNEKTTIYTDLILVQNIFQFGIAIE